MIIFLIILTVVQLVIVGLYLYLLGVVEKHHRALIGIVKHLKRKEKNNDR